MARNAFRSLAVSGVVRQCYGAFNKKEPPIHTQHLPAADSKVTRSRDPRSSTSSRLDALRTALPGTVELLYRRRAGLIGDSTIGDYVALHWLEWNGGALRLTVTGQNICDQLKAQARQADLADPAAS